MAAAVSGSPWGDVLGERRHPPEALKFKERSHQAPGPWSSRPASVLVTTRSVQRPHRFLLLCPPRLTASLSPVCVRSSAQASSLEGNQSAGRKACTSLSWLDFPREGGHWGSFPNRPAENSSLALGSSRAGVVPSVPFIFCLKGGLPRLQP